MKLNNPQLNIECNEQGEIKVIKYKGLNVLHDGQNWWDKTYPMIWPNVSFSRSFEVEGKNYVLPKHGFWKSLDWTMAYENGTITQFATHFADEKYPFTIDIQHNIKIDENKVIISTTFSNLGKNEAYFHFGHHPAFIIDQASQIFIKGGIANGIGANTGKFMQEEMDFQKPLMQLPFGQDYDTLVFKNPTDKTIILNAANNVKITCDFNDFDSLQVWKPATAEFVCLEPWIGENDDERDTPKAAKDKVGIITLPGGKIVTKKVVFTFDEIKKVSKENSN